MKLRYAFFKICLLLSVFLQAQNFVVPEQITIKDGLSQGFITCMIQDREGFLWFGTKNGLNRYDGEHFQVFTNNPYNPYSISGDYIVSLYEEGDFIFVGNHNTGLSIYHKQSNRFFKIPFPNYPLKKGSSKFARNITKDSLGQFWFIDASNNLLVRLLFPKDFWKNLPSNEDLLNQIKYDVIEISDRNAIKLNKEHLFIYFGKEDSEFIKINIQTLQQEGFIPKLPSGQKPSELSFKSISDTCFLVKTKTTSNQDWNYWLWNFEENTWKQTTKYLDNDRCLWNESYSLHKNLKGEWLFFDKKKLESGEINEQDADFSIDGGINFNSTLIDKSGVQWLGTKGYGLRKLTSRKTKIKTYSNSSVYIRPYATKDGEIIFGNSSKESSNIFYNPGTNPKLIKNGLYNYFKKQENVRVWDGNNQSLWVIGFKDEGRQIYHIPKDGVIPAKPEFSLQGNSTVLGRDDAKNLIYVASNLELTEYDVKQKTVKKHALSQVINENAIVLSMALTKNNHWWLGTTRGLIECIPTQNGFTFKLIQVDKNQTSIGNSKGLLNNNVASLLTDPKDQNILWIGTKGGGLHRLDTKTMSYSHLTTQNGLPNNVIYGVLNDKKGNLWMSSNKGIIKYNPTTGTIRNYTEADGMQSNEFNTWAYSKSLNGEMLFGGIYGLNTFYPDDLKDNPVVPKVLLTGLLVNNQKIAVNDSTEYLNKAIEFTKQITLPYTQNSFTLQFSALEYTVPTKNRFRYYLEGSEKDWIHESNKNEAQYLSLSPGNYTFKIKGSNSDGVWSDEVTEIKINILPPWYRSNLAYFIYALIVSLAFWLAFKMQKNRLQLQYNVQAEQKEAERLKELDVAKSRLYTNITHEFRTPLTVISGIADQLKEDNLSENKQLIKRNSDQLLNLVNQMLDLRKIESGEISIQNKQGDIVTFLRYLTESIKSYAELKGLTIHFLSDEEAILMDFDAEKITRIHSNLISNAIKFTPDGGDIYIQLSVEEHAEERNFILKFRDTGIGIAKNQLPLIFERFYQADNSSTRKGEGTGIGLTLVLALTKAMGGTINVSSVEGEGVTFITKLPITNIAEISDTSNFEDASNTSMVAIATPMLSDEVLGSKTETTEKPTALIVEDNADVIHYLINCLKDSYAIEIAMNGEEGIIKAIENTPDIIVSDVMMPIKDGFELCDTLKTDERTSHIPIILLTAKADIESRLEGLKCGADAYLSKPFHQEELLIILQTQLELRKKLQARFSQFSKESLPIEITSAITENEIEIDFETEDAFLLKIKTIIEKDISNSEIGMLQLVRSLSLSRSQIFKKVKALTGNSPSIYVRSIRLHHAHKLLKTTDFNVSEIAYKVGFSTPSYFSDVFFEEFGIRPNETRT